MNSVKATGGTAFTQALTEEYRAFVAEEKAEYDWSTAKHFASKGLSAADGEMVMPEGAGSAEDLNGARSRLVQALDGGARDSNPAVAAKAQRAFDCWVHEAKEKLGDQHLAPCRDEFLQAVGELEAKPQAEAAPAPQAPAPAPSPSTYTVLFDWNRADVNTAGASVLDRVLADAKSKSATTTSPQPAMPIAPAARTTTEKLSLKRADVVREYLIKGGMPAEQITVSGRGEADPAVPTAPNTREPANRRVEIILQ